MLATVDISNPVDEYGNVFEPKIEYNNAVFGYVMSSMPFIYIRSFTLNE
jgi:hypothetical protein